MQRIQKNQIVFYQFDNLQKYDSRIAHCVTTRCGKQEEEFFSIKSQPNLVQALKNRKAFCDLISINSDNLLFPDQVHGNKIAVITKYCDAKEKRENGIPEVDGLMTNLPHIPLMARSGDCPTIGFYDPENNAIAVVHAGWRGTVAEIAMKCIDKMQETYNTDTKKLIASIAPSIGPCCYVVGEEVRQCALGKEWQKESFFTKDSQLYFDLWKANSLQLQLAGIPVQNIECAKICTKCHHEEFFSYRIEKGTGLFGFIICLR